MSGFCWSELDDPAPLDWLVVVDCDVEELGFVVVDCWSALAPLVTLCEPLPTFTPGLMFAPAFTLELSTPTFAPTPTFGFTFVLLDVPDVPEVPELVEPLVVPLDWSAVPLAPLVVLPEPDDWLLVAPWDIEDDGLVVVVCWSALAPLVTLCEPLPMFTPGLTSAPMFALELLTPTFASTPTFGFTLSDLDDVLSVPLVEEDPEALGLEDCELELLEGLLEVLDGLLEDPESLALRSMELELELDEGLVDCAPLRFTSTLLELDELDDGDCAEPLPFRLMSVELDELEGAVGAAPAPFRWMSVELDELDPGTVAVPFTPVSMSVREDELAPGTTATPGPTSVVVVLVLPDWASGTLGMHPAGCVFAASMHFGAPAGMSTVYLSACATPKAASIEAARRLIVKLFRFISFPPS